MICFSIYFSFLITHFSQRVYIIRGCLNGVDAAVTHVIQLNESVFFALLCTNKMLCAHLVSGGHAAHVIKSHSALVFQCTLD